MDLWVRDSTKTKLIKVDNVYLKKLDTSIFEPKLLKYQGIDYIYCIFTNNECLGEYNSEERAMEVLDEIQKLVDQKVMCFVNSPCSLDLKDALKVKDYADTYGVIPSDRAMGEIKYISPNSVVFEMPKK